MGNGQGETEATVRVWDLPVRLYHWTQAALVTLALLSGLLAPLPWFNLHVVTGYAITALLAFRLVWGLFGSEYSRFASFVFHPRRVIAHVGAVLRGRPSHHLGHNPGGAVMVTVLLGAVLVIVASGLLALGGEDKAGPLGALASYATGHAAHAVHQLVAYAVIPLVAIHLLGVAIESRLGRHSLIRAMIDGDKPLPADQPPPALQPARPGPALAACAGLALVTALGLAWAAGRPIPGVPDLPANPVYRAECGACHWAYHPSLLPADSWRRMMTGLEDHFGEDAGMSPAHAATILAWLTGHAAESWDTLAANRLRRIDPAKPLRITATPFWQARHHDIPAPVFKAVKGGAGNCLACHRDADGGRFGFRNILLPAETPR